MISLQDQNCPKLGRYICQSVPTVRPLQWICGRDFHKASLEPDDNPLIAAQCNHPVHSLSGAIEVR
jgi:hypothetical protein